MTAVRSLTFESLGGEVELFAIEPAEPLDATAEWIRGLHDRLTRFEPDSELSRFNARAGEWVDVSPALHDLIVASLKACEESEGLVNVAILPALMSAGYDTTFEEVLHRQVVTDAEVAHPGLRAFRQRGAAKWQHSVADRQRGVASWQRGVAKTRESERQSTPIRVPIPSLPDLLQVRPHSARLARGAGIDLGGIAKGWIADRAVERLGPDSLVSCGGDLHARGGGETGEGWPVGFGDRTLLLKDMAAATSGTSKRRWGDGKHHLIDPRTGEPSTSDLTEVSVLADSAVDAEVFAKTAFLLGSERAEEYLRPRSKGWALS